MGVQLLYQFPVTAPKRELPRAWLFQERGDGIVAVAYVSNRVQLSPVSCSLSFLLVDLNSKTVLKAITSSLFFADIEGLHVAYDSVTATWIVASLEYREDTWSFHIVVRLIREDDNGQLVLSDPIYDDPANDMAPIGPIFALQAHGNNCRMLYLKPDIDRVSTPAILLAQIDMTTRHIDQSIKGYAESALLCQEGSTSLLLALIPLIGELSPKVDGVFVGSARNWGFSATGYENNLDTTNWSRNLDIHLPAGKYFILGAHTDFEWLGINATASAGPLLPMNGQPTFVIGMTMMDIFNLEGHDHTSEEASMIPRKVDTLMCIDTHGHDVQRCTDFIGLRLHLCQSTSLVVGVDLVEGHWRLWNWAPLDDASLKTSVWLDQHIIRAHVVRETAQKDENHFWLFEESSAGVRISQRDMSTLAEVSPAVMLNGVHLLLPQNGRGSLDWHTSIEVLFYQDTLLLLAVDERNQLGFYQVK